MFHIINNLGLLHRSSFVVHAVCVTEIHYIWVIDVRVDRSSHVIVVVGSFLPLRRCSFRRCIHWVQPLIMEKFNLGSNGLSAMHHCSVISFHFDGRCKFLIEQLSLYLSLLRSCNVSFHCFRIDRWNFRSSHFGNKVVFELPFVNGSLRGQSIRVNCRRISFSFDTEGHVNSTLSWRSQNGVCCFKTHC
ncbi:hypothetical protein CLUG_01457 [Clavispora lusitaniae ATCC 42720]|uniref:Uncharacterized protein n=1 Tax=Clavispora lusitaniae (strain ATCC 42720) TaxID=306902 RepID=C4XZS5_CLAL4|nr:uncharacterized protein CLUG_01457 [Clavispora lusitaniae ATCC 42720]EEQ37333.1 hypothetical protein CLUG_01457 [Clavispora lusitaniae ATCC 42720]